VVSTADTTSRRNARRRREGIPARRRRAGLAILLLAALAVAACSSVPGSSPGAGPQGAGPQGVASLGARSPATATTSQPASSDPGPGQPSAGGSNAALEFSQCMRAHGVSDYPDPGPGGEVTFSNSDVNPSSPAFQAAQRTCQNYSSAGSPTGQVLTRDLDQLLRYAKCMRSHGIISFPDPVLRSGLPPGFDFTNMDLTSPSFLAADHVCHSLLPHGGEGHGP
jgi:hypothetical protein